MSLKPPPTQHALSASAASLMPPADSRWLGSLLMALVAHALLVAALTWGIGWQKQTTTAVAQAELWARMPQSAAPRLVDEGPDSTEREGEETKAAPPPQPAPQPVRPTEKAPPVEEPAKAQADIALQQQREREQAKRQLQEKKEQQARQQAELERKAAEKAAKEKAEKEKLAKEKLAEEKAAKEKASKEKETKEAREKAARDKRAQEVADKAQAAQAAKDRAEVQKRIMGMANASGDAGSTGTAKQSSGPSVGPATGGTPGGPSAGYAGRIVSAVRPNIVFTDTISGNPTAEVEVRTLPDGTVASRRIVKSSGVPSWDEAVLKALDRTARLPRDENGRVPATLTIAFSPKEK